MAAQQVSLHRGGMPRRSGNQLQGFGREFDEMFRTFFEDLLPQAWPSDVDITAPSTDVVETDREVRITAEVPGMNADDISITVNEGYVAIRGEKKEESEEDNEGYYRRERSFGEFRRVIALPPNTVNTDNAEARLDKGVLTITIPKRSETQAKTHRLEVKQGESSASERGRGSQRMGAGKGEESRSMGGREEERTGRTERTGMGMSQGESDKGQQSMETPPNRESRSTSAQGNSEQRDSEGRTTRPNR